MCQQPLDQFGVCVGLFQTALTFVRRTLKTNFFVPEKGALAFRLDPAYLTDLGPEFTSDLPPRLPFRVTYFCGRHAIGFHVGFADIARGGWRTLVTKTRDDYVTVANRVFHETYVLAHTQNLKNKDIYEGGSKMVVVIQAPDVETREQMNRRLHEVQLAGGEGFDVVGMAFAGVPAVLFQERTGFPLTLVEPALREAEAPYGAETGLKSAPSHRL